MFLENVPDWPYGWLAREKTFDVLRNFNDKFFATVCSIEFVIFSQRLIDGCLIILFIHVFRGIVSWAVLCLVFNCCVFALNHSQVFMKEIRLPHSYSNIIALHKIREMRVWGRQGICFWVLKKEIMLCRKVRHAIKTGSALSELALGYSLLIHIVVNCDQWGKLFNMTLKSKNWSRCWLEPQCWGHSHIFQLRIWLSMWIQRSLRNLDLCLRFG